MAPPSVSRFWCFTCNNYTDEDEERLKKLAGVQWIMWGHECVSTPHLQGVIWLAKATTKQNLGRKMKNCWLGVPGPEKALEYWLRYCSKQDVNPIQIGIPPSGEDVDEEISKHGKQGQRNDLEAFKADVKAGITDLKILREKHSSVFARSKEFCMDYIQDHRPRPAAPDIVLHPWQNDIVSMIDGPADDRKIFFYYDPVGGAGKTTFAKYLVRTRDDTQMLCPSKIENMLHIVDQDKPVVLINCPRDSMQFLQYSAIELIKDGEFDSPKYQGRKKWFSRTPHVLVFCNEYPDMSKLSQDRFEIVELSK